jgi:plastocyanin
MQAPQLKSVEAMASHSTVQGTAFVYLLYCKPTALEGQIIQEASVDTTLHRRRSLARRTFLSGVASSTATVILAACGGKATNTPVPAATAPPASAAAAPASAPAGANSVTIASFAFAPPSLTVAPGQTVTWTNKDTTTHTVTEDKGAWDSKNLAVGGTFQQKFDQAGTFTYHCNIHSSMKGTVVVQPR